MYQQQIKFGDRFQEYNCMHERQEEFNKNLTDLSSYLSSVTTRLWNKAHGQMSADRSTVDSQESEYTDSLGDSQDEDDLVRSEDPSRMDMAQ